MRFFHLEKKYLNGYESKYEDLSLSKLDTNWGIYI
jgi:hypothetical protein